MTRPEVKADELTFALDARRSARPLQEEDAEELYAVVAANRSYLERWMPWAAEQTLDGTLEFIRRVTGQLAQNDGFSVALIEERRIVGTAGLHRLDWQNRSTSVGYWIAEASQGSGTVTRAVSALLDRAFGSWELNRVEIRAGVENARSQAVAVRLGFRQEGVLRQAERFSDHYADDVLYALLASEWLSRQS